VVLEFFLGEIRGFKKVVSPKEHCPRNHTPPFSIISKFPRPVKKINTFFRGHHFLFCQEKNTDLPKKHSVIFRTPLCNLSSIKFGSPMPDSLSITRTPLGLVLGLILEMCQGNSYHTPLTVGVSLCTYTP